MIKVAVFDSNLTVVGKTQINTGSENYYQVAFVFNETWDNFSKYAVFYQVANQPKIEVELVSFNNGENFVCNLPNELLIADLPIYIGAYGVYENNVTQIISTNFAALPVRLGAFSNNLISADSNNYSLVRSADTKIRLIRENNNNFEYSTDGDNWIALSTKTQYETLFAKIQEIEQAISELSNLDSRVSALENTTTSHTITLENHETRIDTLESAVSEDTATPTNKIGYLSNDVLGVTYENLTANSYTGTNLQSRITTAENGITSLGTRMTTAEGDIDSLEGRMSTAESDIDGLETEVSDLVTYTENAVDTLTDDVANCVKKTGETSQTIEGAITIGTTSNNANLTVNGNINGKQITAGNGLTVTSGGADITGNTAIKGDTIIGATGNAKNLTVTGNTTIGGNLTVNGTTTTIDTQSLEVADNLIVANRNGTALGTNLSGLAIKTGTGSTNNAYGIVYDAVNDVVKLGQGTVTNGDFTYNTNQGQSIATRAYDIVSGHFVEWDGTNSTLVDGGAKIANKTSMGSSGSANLSLVGVDSASNLVVSKQNLFNAVTVNNGSSSSSITADSPTTTLTVEGSGSVSVALDTTTKKLTIMGTDTTYAEATTSTAGLMSATDKSRLDTLYTNIGTKTVENTVSTSANLITSGAVKTYVDNIIGDINSLLITLNTGTGV